MVAPSIVIESNGKKSITLSWVVILWLISMVFGAGVSSATFATKDEQTKQHEAIRLEAQNERNELRKEMNEKFSKIIDLLGKRK